MPLRLILRRAWRERRMLGVLLLAMCLVTGFFALGPLYARAVAEAGARYLVEGAAQQQLNVTIINPEPIAPENWERVLSPNLGAFVTDAMQFAYAVGPATVPHQGMICGFAAEPGAPITADTPSTLMQRCYKPFGYPDPHAVFTLVEGRWPATDPAASTSAAVEALVTTKVAQTAGLAVGDAFVLGNTPDRTATIRITGLVEPALDPTDAFWNLQNVVLNGVYTIIGLEVRYDFGPIFPQAVFDRRIAPLADQNAYLWWMRVKPGVIDVDALETLDASLRRVQGELQLQYPEVDVLSGLNDLIAAFRAGVAEVEGPVVLMSGAVLVLMLYNLVTTAALVLEQQRREWATLSSRGASAWQLARLQLATVALIAVPAFALGPLIALGILRVLAHVGPLAGILDGASGSAALPASAFALSLIAAAGAVVALTLPAWSAAQHSLQALQQQTSRPPTRPAWARYYLDVVLLALGMGFMLRLYFLVSGDVGASLRALLQDPTTLIRWAAAGEGSLTDPFNLVGPALLLTGAALLWLRLFPWLMRAVGRLFRRARGLTVPLALWTIGRDPGHYAQLVLLLIGTLALGTASLAIQATHDAGAWSVAQRETGSDVRVTFAPAAGAVQEWRNLPGVQRGAQVMRVAEENGAGAKAMTLLGVDPAAVGAAFPALSATIAPLAGAPAPEPGGIALPANAAALTIQIMAGPDPEPTRTRLEVVLQDALGIPVSVPMTPPTTADELSADRFVRYTAALADAPGHPPWRLTGLRMRPQRGDQTTFEHVVYIDDVTLVDGDGREALLEGFESADFAGWTTTLARDFIVLRNTKMASSGGASLCIDYLVTRAAPEPFLPVYYTGAPRVPVVLSAQFAAEVGRRTGSRPLQVGDGGVVNLNLPLGAAELRYQVTGIARDFPTVGVQDYFLVAPIEALRVALNANAAPDAYYDWNQTWLTLAAREPGDDFRAAVSRAPGVVEVAYAWDRYRALQREPLPNAITGMLYAGFWVSLGLAVLDFAFYLYVTTRRRAGAFAVLQAMGWEARNIWGLLAVEQVALVAPALLVGVALGAALAFLLLPFLTLLGTEALRLPPGSVAWLLLALGVTFALLLSAAAFALRRAAAHQVLRFSEE